MSAPTSRSRFNGRVYPFDEFDQHLCLKPPLGLTLCLIFLCRDLLFAIDSMLSSARGSGIDMSMLISHRHHLIFIAGMMPALAVFWAHLRRLPGRSGVVRVVWQTGAVMLTAAVAIQSIPALMALWQGRWSGGELFESPWLLIPMAGILSYLFASKRLRDTFSDYPQI